MRKITKPLFVMLLMLLLMACQQSDLTADDEIQAQVNALKLFCDNRVPCLAKVEQQAKACQHHLPVSTDDTAINSAQQAKAEAQFMVCIIEAMDQSYNQRVNQLIPVKETAIEPLPGASVSVNYDFVGNPKVLQVIELDGQLQVNGELIQANQLKNRIRAKRLTESFKSVVLIVSDETDTGLFVSAMDDLKQLGFDQVNIARKEKLDQYQNK
ncbi:ExbD/TolR family protein [Marinicella meishanensis]|uniref:ExbD/TolR family protein n=1 Tax=Marinicella meishanensis TaxID=2873263 RepID=UPI001CBC447A|nr:biopolymer transporter ExbD [Marinicella sp. NBU2979]